MPLPVQRRPPRDIPNKNPMRVPPRPSLVEDPRSRMMLDPHCENLEARWGACDPALGQLFWKGPGARFFFGLRKLSV